MAIKKYIPDCITLMNLLSGVLACTAALQGHFYCAFILIVAAAAFDFFDGFAARALDAYSPLGKELDSLCDLVSFGLAPGLMLQQWYMYWAHTPHASIGWIALAMPLAAALRLAKFNTDTRQSVDFIGLPVPGSAMVAAPLVAFVHIAATRNCTGCGDFMFSLLCSTWFIPVLAVLLSFLMVSEIPMFSMKHKKLSFRQFPLSTVFLCCAVLVFIVLQSIDLASPVHAGFFFSAFPLGLCLSFTLYVLLNVFAAAFRSRKSE